MLFRSELVRNGEVLQTATSGNRGEWTFASVEPGDYVVRTTVNGQVAGTRVFVMAGQPVARAIVVVPAAAAPSATFFFAPLMLVLGAPATIVLSTVVVGGVVWAVAARLYEAPLSP